MTRRITLMAVGVVGVFLAGISQLRSQEAIPVAPLSESTTTDVVPSGTDRRTQLEESYLRVMDAQLKLMQDQARLMTDKELEDAIQRGQRAVSEATADAALQTAVRDSYRSWMRSPTNTLRRLRPRRRSSFAMWRVPRPHGPEIRPPMIHLCLPPHWLL